MLTETQKKKLNENLRPDAISQRDGGGGRKLSYVEGWYVLDRLNDILGPGAWSYDVTTREVVRESRTGDKGERWHVTYSAKCVLTLDAGAVSLGDVGHGHGIDRDLGAAIESAEKEAATDALKRAAKSLGRSMGLALYQKSQEHVGHTVDSVIDALAACSNAEQFARAIADYRSIAPRISSEEEALITAAGAAARERLGLAKSNGSKTNTTTT
jgi:DNA recombination protein Rad52